MKKLLATIMALVMALSLLPTAWADGDDDGAAASKTVAKIGDSVYKTLADAVNAAQAGDTITLTYDVTLDSKLTINKAITLDGDNHTITGKNDSSTVYIEITGGNVTVQNLKVKDFGGNAPTTTQWGLFKVPDNLTSTGKLVAKNITASNFNRAAFDIRSGSFEIDNCVIDCENQYTDKLTKGVLAQNVTGTVSNTTITNAATTYTQEGNAWNTNAIETWGNTTLTVSGCTLGTADALVKNGVSMNTGTGASKVTITNTTIVASDRIAKLTPDENKTGTSALTIDSGNYTGTLKINQGTVKGEGCSISVTGGTFSSDPSDFVADGYVANGTNGTWTVTEFTSGETKTTTTKTEDGTTTTTVEDVNLPDTNTNVAVTIDASEATTVTINTDVAKKLSENSGKIATVEVKTNVATLTIDQNALKTLTEKEGDLVLTVSKSETSTTETKFDLTAKVGTNDVFKNSAGKITITVPMDAPGFRQQLVCYYVAEDGARTRMGGAGYKDNTFSWDTNHFSEFVVVTETVSNSRASINISGSSTGTTTTTTTTTGKAASATTFDAGVGVYAATAILSVTGMAWVGKKKH